MKAGSLKHRITFQERKELSDSVGAKHIELRNLLTVWAAVEPISGRENFDSSHYASETNLKITVRYNQCIAKMTAKNRIKHGDKIYNIEAVIADASGKVNLRFICSEADDDRFQN